jgi:hypothetical protein
MCERSPSKMHCCRVNNLENVASEKRLNALPNDTVVQRALAFMEKDIIETYSLRYRNCEHFATSCRYYHPFSTQVERVAKFMPITLLRRDIDIFDSATEYAGGP